jgi:GcrA cell cycle regulator
VAQWEAEFWPDERVRQLRLLWVVEPRLSTSEIGRRLGVSKNAVVGKAHRLDLPARPSPIRRSTDSEKREAYRRRLDKLRLARLAVRRAAADAEADAGIRWGVGSS